MIILTYINKLVWTLEIENIPEEGKIALILFILHLILLLNFLNIMTYFLIRVNITNKRLQDLMKESRIFRRIVWIYGKTRILFIIFEIYLCIYIILWIIYYSHKLFILSLSY